MKLTIAAIGRMKAGADRDLVERYVARASKAGKGIGLGPLTIREMPEARAARATERTEMEADRLLANVPQNALKIALDEHGTARSSITFANFLGRYRDQGISECWLFIGGADGHGKSLLDQVDLRLSLGEMTWPHQLVRIMIAEQIYRAVTILSGHPYHRS